MIPIGKGILAENIRLLRLRVCCYLSESFCDCKFGVTSKPPANKEDILRYKAQHWTGEMTGCPELRTVQALLALMTDEEYKAILSRGRM